MPRSSLRSTAKDVQQQVWQVILEKLRVWHIVVFVQVLAVLSAAVTELLWRYHGKDARKKPDTIGIWSASFQLTDLITDIACLTVMVSVWWQLGAVGFLHLACMIVVNMFIVRKFVAGIKKNDPDYWVTITRNGTTMPFLAVVVVSLFGPSLLKVLGTRMLGLGLFCLDMDKLFKYKVYFNLGAVAEGSVQIALNLVLVFYNLGTMTRQERVTAFMSAGFSIFSMLLALVEFCFAERRDEGGYNMLEDDAQIDQPLPPVQGVSQRKMLKDILPVIMERGHTYQQKSKKLARKARRDEIIHMMKDGVPVCEIRVKDDKTWVIDNEVTKESYTLSTKEFEQYTDGDLGEEIPDRRKLHDKGFRMYKFNKKVLAFQLQKDDVKSFFPELLWQRRSGAMSSDVGEGHWVACPHPGHHEVYCVANDYFWSAYKQIGAAAQSNMATTQEQMKKVWVPILQEKGTLYKQDSTKTCRRAIAGETVKQVAHGEEICKVTVDNNTTWVVLNDITKETYTLADEEFQQYTDGDQGEPVTDNRQQELGFKKYKFSKSILAYQLTADDIERHFPNGAWERRSGAKSVDIGDGYWIASPQPACHEVYCIADEYLNQAYRSQGHIKFLTQQQMIETWVPLLEEKGQLCRQEQQKLARRGIKEEVVRQVVRGQLVCEHQIADDETWVLQDLATKEFYTLKDDEFRQYTAGASGAPLEDASVPVSMDASMSDTGFKSYTFVKNILAYPLTSMDIAKYFPGRAWQRRTGAISRDVDAGYWVATPHPGRQEVYCINPDNFKKKYQIIGSAPSAVSQSEMMATWLPWLKKAEQLYEQNSIRLARRARLGEKVAQVSNGEVVCEFQVDNDSTWVVYNDVTQETYALSNEEFCHYTRNKLGTELASQPRLQEKGFRKYAFTKTLSVRQLSRQDFETYFPSRSWRRRSGAVSTDVDADHWIAIPQPNAYEVYCLSDAYFKQAYQPTGKTSVSVSQDDMAKTWIPRLKGKARLYRQQGYKYARRSKIGEKVVQVTGGEVVCEEVGDGSQWVLQNEVTKETYILNDDDFKHYTAGKEGEEIKDQIKMYERGFKKYAFTKSILAYQLTRTEDLDLHFPNRMWQRKSGAISKDVDVGYWVACPQPFAPSGRSREIYCIADEYFKIAYRPIFTDEDDLSVQVACASFCHICPNSFLLLSRAKNCDTKIGSAKSLGPA